MNIHPFRTFWLIWFGLWLWLPAAGAGELAVIVHRDNAAVLDQQGVSNFYLGRSHTFASGQYAAILDLPRDSVVRERFFRRLNGMSLPQVNTYWARLMFSGRVLPPPSLADQQDMLKAVRDNPLAIGYVEASQVDASVRVVLRLQE